MLDLMNQCWRRVERKIRDDQPRSNDELAIFHSITFTVNSTNDTHYGTFECVSGNLSRENTQVCYRAINSAAEVPPHLSFSTSEFEEYSRNLEHLYCDSTALESHHPLFQIIKWRGQHLKTISLRRHPVRLVFL
jgi:hypothetical protein